MAPTKVCVWKISFLLFLACSSLNFSAARPITSSSGSNIRFRGVFDSIYQFGDGFSDTGNMHIQNPSYGSACSYPPYGETLSADPTGRCSDGLVMVDYFARALDLPPLEPYLGINNTYFPSAVNFAVDAATVFAPEPDFRHDSLSAQLEWFRSFHNSECSSSSTSSSSECKNRLERSLFVVGGIGANDYKLEHGASLAAAHDMIPRIVQSIANGVKQLIDQGAKNVVVPGLFPLGCMPNYQKHHHHDSSASSYDNLGCHKPLNELARVHNEQLQQALDQVQKEYPRAAVLYGDYYQGYVWLLENAASLGFENSAAFEQCCDGPCGFPNGVLCPDPKKRISWDGVHLTQEANKYLADWLLSDLFSGTHSTSTSTSPAPSSSQAPSPSYDGWTSSASPAPSPSYSVWTIWSKLF